MADWQNFCTQAQSIKPRAMLVLGSGLGEVASDWQVVEQQSFADIPGLVPPTVQGHKGQLSLGYWNSVPMLVSLGRVHGYEGHALERVTRLVNLAADLGVMSVVLTNAAGGIREDLLPGSLMPISGHLKLLDSDSWRNLRATQGIYEAGWATPTKPGIYAALTGPNYETPAEIRALRSIGADAVGMSTAREAEAAVARGLRVFGISCITNVAAGLADGVLSHSEVEQNAKLAIKRLQELLGALLAKL
jgi:purine-nucleoside phosphorylase